MNCNLRLDDFKKFHDQCLENEKIWDKFSADDVSMHSDTAEYLEEYIEDMVVEELPEMETPKIELGNHDDDDTKDKVKRKKKKVTIALAPGFKYKTMNEVEEEDDQIRKVFNLECQKCDPGVRSHTFNEYKMHLKNVHKDYRPGLICCGKKLSKRMDVIDHMNFHLDPDKLKCPQCQRVYSDRKNLRAHILQLHGTAEDKPYECHDCGKRYAKLEPLRAHMRSHLSEETKQSMKNFVCDECGQYFLTNAVLKAHIKYTHLRQGYVCDSCARHFKSKFDYQLHRRNVHGEDGPSREQCPICEKWYSNSKALKCHIKGFHDRTEPIICKICGIETTSKQGLYGHMRMKHMERAYHCDYCSKSFATPCRLKEHRAMHTGVSLYSCMYCPDKHFNVRANMYKHFKAMHPGEWERDKVNKNRNPDMYKTSQNNLD